MYDLQTFDARCTIGRHLTLREGGRSTAAELLEDMDRHGIAEALVLDSLARELHPEPGNARLLDAIGVSPRLHAAWVALPSGTRDEQPESETLLATMRAHKVGALFLLPTQYRFTLHDWCIDALLEPFAAERVPVFLCYDEVGPGAGRGDQTNWEAVVNLCRRWPTLPVVVSEWRVRRSQRLIYRALEACENLHIELSGYFLHHGIEYITRNWGSRRLIFGSNWPEFPAGMTLAPLTRAEISEADKRAIAGDNLRALLRWCAPVHPHVELPPPADPYVAIGLGADVPADKRFADCHGHLGGRSNHYHLPDTDLDATVAEMERQGIDRGCVFSFAGVGSDEVYGNDVVAEAIKRYPECFVGFTLLNPHRGRAAMLAELERCAALGFRGIKLIPYYQMYPEHGPLIDVACEWAHAHKQLILNHSWGSAEQMARLTAEYPNACFINGHYHDGFAEVAKQRDNLFICTCPLWGGPRATEHAVATYGADRLLFGSDLQDLPIAWGTGPILFADISEAEKGLILGGNLRRLLKQYSLPS